MKSDAFGAVTPATSEPPAPVAASRKFRIDDRYIAPAFITLILVVGHLKFGILDDNTGVFKTICAILASIATELILGRLFTGKWPHWASAYISGISVGILVRSTFFWPYILCSAIAITSKYVIRVKGRHLWNPSNLGIVCLLLLAPKYVATLSVQFGNNLWPMVAIWILGSVIIYRLKRFHICATYVACFFAYALLRAGLNPNHALPGDFRQRFLLEIAPITGPMYQLFIFFMITDPKTTVKSKSGQMFVAFLVATAENFMRMWGMVDSHDTANLIASHAPYFALTLMGPAANLLEILRSPARPTPKPVTPVT